MFREGGVHKNVSQILATIDFFNGEIAEKSLSVRKNFMGNINLGQISHLNMDKYGIGNDIPGHRLAPFA